MRTFLTITYCLWGISMIAQMNTAFLELGGMGGFSSLNYEWNFNSTSGLGFRVGVGATVFGFIEDVPDMTTSGCAICGVDLPGPETLALTTPISIQYLFDLDKNNYLEAGAGGSWQLSEGSKYAFFANFGFRRYFGDNGKWMWKANFTPLLGVAGNNAVKDNESTVWGGVSIGKRF